MTRATTGKPRTTRKATPLSPLLKQYAAELFVDAVPNPGAAYTRACEKLGKRKPKNPNGRAYGALQDPRFRLFAEKLRKPAEIVQDVLLSDTVLTVQRTEKEIARLAFVDVGNMFDARNCLLPLALMPEDTRRAIVSIEVDELFERVGPDADKLLDELLPLLHDIVAETKPDLLKSQITALKAWLADMPDEDSRERVLVGHTRKVKIADKKGALELAGRRDGIFRDRVELSGKVTLEDILAESRNDNKDNSHG